MQPLTTTRPEIICLQTAAEQYGLFSLAQARAAGVTRQVLRTRVAAKEFTCPLPDVFAVAGAPASSRRDLMAACLWAGPETAASHRAAANLWGWNGFESPPAEISTTSRKRPFGFDIVAHRVDRYLLEEITSVAGIPVTSARRTLLDLCGKKHPRRERALDQALREESVSLPHIWRLYEQEWTRGRRGIAILRDFLVQRTPGEAPTQSELEDMLAKIIKEAGLPAPQRQYEIALPSGTKYIDFAYPELMLAIETDGYAWHGDRESFDGDRDRDNELQTLGWRVLRFSYSMLRWEPERVIATIRAALFAG